MRCMQMRMPPSTSATTTLPGSSNPGRLQSISRMDGVPQVNRQRSLWAKRSRPSLRLVLKVVDSVHDTETMKYIISYYPSLIWNRDDEGRNAFHYYFKDFEEDGDFLFEIFIAEFKDLYLVLPSELLYEKDNQGKYPFDYLPHSEVLKEIIRRDKYCDS